MKSGTYRKLMDKLDAIEQYVLTARTQTPSGDGIWLNNDEACVCLKVSRRTLQRYRSNGTVAYTLFGNRAYYKLTEISRIMEKGRAVRGDVSSVEPSAGE